MDKLDAFACYVFCFVSLSLPLSLPLCPPLPPSLSRKELVWPHDPNQNLEQYKQESVKLFLCILWSHVGGTGGKTTFTLILGTRWRLVYHWRKNLIFTQWIKGYVGSRVCQDAWEKREVLSLLQTFSYADSVPAAQ